AIAELRQAGQQHPNDASLQFRLAQVYLMKTPPQTALALPRLLRAAELVPRSPEVWHELGGVYLATHHAPEAVAAFRRAAELAPSPPMAQYELGTAPQATPQTQPPTAAARPATQV